MKAAFCSLLIAMPLLAADPASTAINQLGLDLHRRLAAEHPAENLCFSPYSIQTAMAMTYAGASGATEAEMAKVLHYPQGDSISASLPALSKALAGITEKTTQMVERNKRYGGSGDPVILTTANRLFGQKGFAFNDTYLSVLKDMYGAPLEQLDFSKPEPARDHINGWVEKETRTRIKNLIPQGALSPASRLVLVNAVYLKAPWAEKFWPDSTQPEPFHLANGNTKNVPTMIQQEKFGYKKHEGFSVVSLPYFGNDLHFLIIVPDKVDGLAEVEKQLTSEVLSDCGGLARTEVILHLPKFKIEGGGISLKKELQALGMQTAFDIPKGSADFRAMAPRTPENYLYISDVVHKAFIALDENGTEAAAATAVIAAAGAAAPEPKKPVEVKVDRPFLFAIQHCASGACIFLGRVTEPQ